jgi:hypothetical protein
MKTINTELFTVDFPNTNGRIYDIEAARKIEADFKENPVGTCWGNILIPSGAFSLAEASHVVRGINIITMYNEINSSPVYKIWATIEFLDTHYGRIAEKLWNKGKGKFATSCMGVVDKHGRVTVENFITIHMIDCNDDSVQDVITPTRDRNPIASEISLGKYQTCCLTEFNLGSNNTRSRRLLIKTN